MVKCEIGDNIPCEGNIKVKQSECRNGAKVPVPIKVTWRYCNEDTDVQKPVQSLVVPRYKSGIMQEERLGDNVEPGTCVDITSNKSINFCKKGATISLKYEATIENNPARKDDYCYAWKFLRIRKEWLKENDGQQCGTTVSPTCI